jgi:AraC family cel operon transcriptional repressor
VPHDHDFSEVFWVEAGRGVHWINGAERELRPGHLILVTPKDRHAVSAVTSQGLRIANVAFITKSWPYVRKRYFPQISDPFAANVPDREFCFSGLSAMRLERLADHFASPGRTMAQIEGFLIELGTILSGGINRPAPGQMPEWLSRACDEIHHPRHFAGGTRSFAALACRSQDHVARETKRWLKRTPTEVVNEARMQYAAARLTSTDDKVLDVAMQCGLENLAHFYVLFQQRFHTTPRRYRLQGRRIVGNG